MKEVPVPVIVEVIKEVPVEIVKEVPVEVVREVPVEVVREIAVPATAVSSTEVPSRVPAASAATANQTASPVAASLAESGTTRPTHFRIGGQARLLSSLEGLIDVDPREPVAKTIRIDILRDENFDYYFASDVPLVVLAGKRVKFVVYNTHFTKDECW